MDWNQIVISAQTRLPDIGLHILGAIVLYVVGRWLIAFVINPVRRVLTKQKLDPTLLRFFGNTISVILNIVLVRPRRRVDLNAQIAGETDPQDAITAIKERLSRISNVLAKPAPVLGDARFPQPMPTYAIRQAEASVAASA
jgi:small-conductance mechanosensitive channel